MQSKRDEREAYVAEAVNEDIRLATKICEIYARNIWSTKSIFIQSIVK